MRTNARTLLAAFHKRFARPGAPAVPPPFRPLWGTERGGI